jgi:protocatechuate 3,4-dioxygenase beta subunit
MTHPPQRPGLPRRLLLGTGIGLAASGTLALPLKAAPRRPTPAQPEGPYYMGGIAREADADLLSVAGRAAEAPHRPLQLAGRIVDLRGDPVAGARVEIWQCDGHGTYHHPRDGGRRDEGFQGYGATLSNDRGEYAFRTIHPVPYGGRTPHIHFKVGRDGFRPLTTQLYVAGEAARNRADGMWSDLPPDAREAITVPFVPEAGAPDGFSAWFEIVLA